MSTVGSQTATVTAVPASTTSASLLAAGGARKAWVVSNPTGVVAYLRFGSGAAVSTDFTVQIAAGGYYESPQPVYAGPVQVILASGTGNVLVTSW
jgi:hypothetical protein